MRSIEPYRVNLREIGYYKYDLADLSHVTLKLFIQGTRVESKLDQYASRMAGPAGIEPTTPGLKIRGSSLSELRALLQRFIAHRRN